MSKRSLIILAGVLAGVGGIVAIGFIYVLLGMPSVETIDKEQVTPPNVEDLLADDKLEDKKPAFNPYLIDSRPFGPPDNLWEINTSAAVIRLDVPATRSDAPEALLRLYPDYASAAKALTDAGFQVLPSVNLVGGKAKQFDDGLYAAIDEWAVRNHESGVRDIERLVRQVLTELSPAGEPHAWLWGCLEVGGMVTPEEYAMRPGKAAAHVQRFEQDAAQSRPVGFYTWNENLRRVFRFLRYLQQPIADRAIADAIARVITADPEWREQYMRVLNLYTGLTNPFVALNLLVLPGNAGKPLDEIAGQVGVRRATVHFLPYSDNREAALFEKLYPQGLPQSADLMRDFIRAIRAGELDLTPQPGCGWYDYQVYALETFLLPERGKEHEKLLLTKQYKLRMLEAFKAMVTKTRETHIRQLHLAAGKAAPPPDGLAPRLRCEPNPTYYLRMARSYAFLQRLLVANVADLNRLRGWRESGPRGLPLGDELEHMRMLFYGLHLVSCEDIGMEAQTLPDEIENADYLRVMAAKWLEDWATDPDMATDTRVAVPVYAMPGQYTRFWATLGVRPMRLEARYVRYPSWRAKQKHGEHPAEWEEVPSYRTQDAEWIILGDDFGEFQRAGNTPLTRKQLREVCDQHKEKAAILKALGK